MKMKNRNSIIVSVLVLLILAIAYFVYNSKTSLNDIYIWSIFPPKDQEVFEQKLWEFEWKELTGYIDVIDKARMYDYLWYPGKAIWVYQDFVKINTGEYIPVLTNIWHLYKKICEVNGKLNRPYCREAISSYEYLVDKYNSSNLYKDMTEVYLKLWNNKKAKKYYALYKKVTGRSESWIEQKLDIK